MANRVVRLPIAGDGVGKTLRRLVPRLLNDDRKRAFEAQRDAGKTPTAAKILPALRHPNPRVRFECLGMLDHLADESSLAAMIATTHDPVPRVRRMAVHALGCMRCKPSPLCRELNAVFLPIAETDPVWRVRREAVIAIAQQPADDRSRTVLARLADGDPHPDVRKQARWALRVQMGLSWAYSRWLTEEVLPHEPRMKTMIYLPFNTPSACMRVIEQFTGKPGVVGFMVTSPRLRPVHDNVYMPIYRALEERNMPLGFHAGLGMGMERAWEGMNRFISVHALGFTWFNIVHMTNMLINGIPERFPKLKIIWIESGLAWIPFLMQRLDNEYMMRTSEAPLLKMKPSEYMANRFYYTTQPIENTNLEALQFNLKMINAEKTLLFASDFPHWDFNLPSTIYDLPFLNEQAKRNILGETARQVYTLEV